MSEVVVWSTLDLPQNPLTPENLYSRQPAGCDGIAPDPRAERRDDALNFAITNALGSTEDDTVWENEDIVTNFEVSCEYRSDELFSKHDTNG
ncbi:hypothetical protein TNCV_89451 [Trichonephila clavipes]|nr:hypothetical protein TNCV_89451 [Trichonephila clavipes]